MISEGPFAYKDVNVVDQRRNPTSLLNWMHRAIQMHRQNPEIGWGDLTILNTDHPSVFAHRCDWDGSAVMMVHNIGADPCTVTIDIGDLDRSAVVEIFADQDYGQARDALPSLRLDGFGYRWLRCRGAQL